MKVIQKLPRKERRALRKLSHTSLYKGFLTLLKPVKFFIVLPFSAGKKMFGIISYSFFWIFGRKVGYIDDFIIHKKLRGTGKAKELFLKAESELQDKQADYMLLFSRSDRKRSHGFYKKMGLTIIGLGMGICAYKKIHKSKK